MTPLEDKLFQEYYSTVFDIFDNSKFELCIDLYLKLSEYFQWTLFASYMIASVFKLENITLVKAEENLSGELEHFMLSINDFSNSSTSVEKEDLSRKIVSFKNVIFIRIVKLIRCLYRLECGEQIETYCDNCATLASDAKNLLEEVKEAKQEALSHVAELQDCLIFWICLQNHSNRLNHQCKCSLEFSVSNLDCLNKFKTVKTLFFIARHKKCSFLPDEGLGYFNQLCYRVMVENLDYFHDWPSFSILPSIQWNISTSATIQQKFERDTFWKSIISPKSLNRLSEDFFLLFDILDRRKCKLELEKHLLYFTGLFLMQSCLEDRDFFEKLFTKRIEIYGLDRIEMGFDCRKLFAGQQRDGKLRVDFQNDYQRKFAAKIVISKFEMNHFKILKLSFLDVFSAPVEALDEILNCTLIYRSLHYNKFISFLFANQLRIPCGHRTLQANILGDSLRCLEYLLIAKLLRHFDLLQPNSFIDLVQTVSKYSGIEDHDGPLIDSHTLFANIIAHHKSSELSLDLLQTLNDLLKLPPPSSAHTAPLKWASDKFALITGQYFFFSASP